MKMSVLLLGAGKVSSSSTPPAGPPPNEPFGLNGISTYDASQMKYPADWLNGNGTNQNEGNSSWICYNLANDGYACNVVGSSGTYGLYFDAQAAPFPPNNPYQTLITKEFSTIGLSSLTISFNMISNPGGAGTKGPDLGLRYSLNGGASWSDIGVISSPSDGVWRNKTTALPAGAENQPSVMIMLSTTDDGTGDSFSAIDDFVIS